MRVNNHDSRGGQDPLGGTKGSDIEQQRGDSEQSLHPWACESRMLHFPSWPHMAKSYKLSHHSSCFLEFLLPAFPWWYWVIYSKGVSLSDPFCAKVSSGMCNWRLCWTGL